MNDLPVVDDVIQASQSEESRSASQLSHTYARAKPTAEGPAFNMAERYQQPRIMNAGDVVSNEIPSVAKLSEAISKRTEQAFKDIKENIVPKIPADVDEKLIEDIKRIMSSAAKDESFDNALRTAIIRTLTAVEVAFYRNDVKAGCIIPSFDKAVKELA